MFAISTSRLRRHGKGVFYGATSPSANSPKKLSSSRAGAALYGGRKPSPRGGDAMSPSRVDVLVRYVRRLHGDQPSDGPTDRELLRLYACHRDEAAFASLVQRHGP